MRVYYLTGAQFALNSIALRRVKISRFRDLNDPFELLGVNLTNKVHREAFRATKEEINKDQGLICFSKSWRNPLIWGHYAERHSGIGLGFDVPDHLLVPVIYAKRLLQINNDPKTNQPVLTEEIIGKLMRTKFYDWQYEDEMRLFVKLDHDTAESGMYFYSFSRDLMLREVILGPRCELPINGVRKIVVDYSPNVQVFKSRIAFSSFQVLKNKASSRRNAKT